jgi:hypothetical protein
MVSCSAKSSLKPCSEALADFLTRVKENARLKKEANEKGGTFAVFQKGLF